MADFIYEVRWWEGLPTSVKSAWSVCILSFKSATYPLLKEIIRDVKQIHIAQPQITQFSCIFNEYEIQHFGKDQKN